MGVNLLAASQQAQLFYIPGLYTLKCSVTDGSGKMGGAGVTLLSGWGSEASLARDTYSHFARTGTLATCDNACYEG